MNQKSIVIAIIALIVGAGVGYGGATAFAAKAPAGGAATYRGAGGAGGSFARSGAGGAGMGLLAGTVAQASDSSLTLNTRDGSSHVVILTPSTAVSKSVVGSLSDVTVGADIIVSGSTGSDGSITATAIQLRPAGSTGPGNAPMIPAQTSAGGQ